LTRQGDGSNPYDGESVLHVEEGSNVINDCIKYIPQCIIARQGDGSNPYDGESVLHIEEEKVKWK
jgi:hypothetical protein